MKILFISGCYAAERGFALARVAAELARETARQGHSVHAVATSLQHSLGEEAWPGMQMHRHKSPYPFFAYNDDLEEVLQSIPLSSCLTELVSGNGPFDVVHAFGWNAGLSAAFLQQTFGIPFALTLPRVLPEDRSVPEDPWGRWTVEMGSWLSQRADYLFAGRIGSAAGGLSSSKTKTFRLGVRTKDFHSRVDLEGFRSLFAPPERKIALHAGRLVPGPEFDQLLDYFVSPPRGARPAHLLIAGDGPGRRVLEETVRKRGAGQGVRFLGSVHSVVLGGLYQVADTYVDPASGEPGLAALEASAIGLPVVGLGYGPDFWKILPGPVHPCAIISKDSVAAAFENAFGKPKASPQRSTPPDWGTAAEEVVRAYAEMRSPASQAL